MAIWLWVNMIPKDTDGHLDVRSQATIIGNRNRKLDDSMSRCYVIHIVYHSYMYTCYDMSNSITMDMYLHSGKFT